MTKENQLNKDIVNIHCMMNFQEFIIEIEKESSNKSILIGNGISISLNENFAYEKLADAIGYPAELISQLETVQKSINQTVDMEEYLNKVEELSTTVRINFFDALKKIHPDYKSVSSEIKNGASFFQKFNKIFTINYDMFLYWIILKVNEQLKKPLFNDGFKRKGVCIFDSKNEINVFFLHGALHFYEEKEKICKVARGSNVNGETFLDKIKKRVGITLSVFEGEHTKKEKSIRSNSYLNFCFESFKNDKNKILVILGVSFNKDVHIKNLIENQKYSKIYINAYNGNPQKLNTSTETELININITESDFRNYLWTHENKINQV